MWSHQLITFYYRSPFELYEKYNSSEMAFNPPIPTPRPIEFKQMKGRHFYNNETFKAECESKLNCHLKGDGNFLNFFADFAK